MKELLFIIFATVLFVFNGSAQCNVPITQNSQYEHQLGPNNDTVYCYNDPVTEILGSYILLQGGSGAYSYQWYSTTDINVSYPNFFNTPATWTLIDGATNATYSPPPVTQSIRYKRLTTDVNCPLLSRNDFSYVLHLYKVDQIVALQKTCSPTTAATIIDKTVDPLWKNTANWYTIQWESSDSENGTFTPIVGATNFLYTPIVQSTIKYYRRSYTADSYTGGTCAAQLTNVVAINPVTCLTFSSSITGSISVTPNQVATYSVPAQAGMQYLWAVTSGTITGGQGTYTITIMWDGGASANTRTSLVDYSVSVTETNDIHATQTTTQPITLNTTTTGINKGFGTSGISVFPNPVKNQFTIEMPTTNTTVNYTVYSTSGVQMQSGSFNAVTSGNTISTQLSAGMYQLVLNYDGVLTSTRLVVVE